MGGGEVPFPSEDCPISFVADYFVIVSSLPRRTESASKNASKKKKSHITTNSSDETTPSSADTEVSDDSKDEKNIGMHRRQQYRNTVEGSIFTEELPPVPRPKERLKKMLKRKVPRKTEMATPSSLTSSTSPHVLLSSDPQVASQLDPAGDHEQDVHVEEPSPTPSIDEIADGQEKEMQANTGKRLTKHETVGDLTQLVHFHPELTARYPQDDIPSRPLNTMVNRFCCPSVEDVSVSLEYHLPTVHHFILTDDRGRRTYATCLKVWEDYFPDPEDDDLAALWRYQNRLTVYDESDTRKEVEICTCSKEEQIKFYLPKFLCLLSPFPFLSAFRSYLTQLYRLATSTDLMVAPLERYIVNICREVPTPPRGALFESVVDLGFGEPIRFRIPPSNDRPIPWMTLPFKTLFECLDVDNVLATWYALTLERKTVLVSSHMSLLVGCAEVLRSLLFPLQHIHSYIPLLPGNMGPLLSAPMPFFVGAPRELYERAISDMYVADDVMIVDLDRNTVVVGSTAPELPPIPKRRLTRLEQALRSAGCYDVFWRARGFHGGDAEFRSLMGRLGREAARAEADHRWNDRMRGCDDAFGQAVTPDWPGILNDDAGEEEVCNWNKVQDTFVMFYASVLINHKRYFAAQNFLNQRGGMFSSHRPEAWSHNGFAFLTDLFLAAQEDEYQPFLQELCCTQMFVEFVQKRMRDVGAPDLQYFDECIEAKRNESIFRRHKVETPLLNSSKYLVAPRAVNAGPPNCCGLPLRDDSEKKTFFYDSFPSTLDASLLSTPRPLPDEIIEEFKNMDERGRGGRERAKHCPESARDDRERSHSDSTNTSTSKAAEKLNSTRSKIRKMRDKSINKLRHIGSTRSSGSSNGRYKYDGAAIVSVDEAATNELVHSPVSREGNTPQNDDVDCREGIEEPRESPHDSDNDVRAEEREGRESGQESKLTLSETDVDNLHESTDTTRSGKNDQERDEIETTNLPAESQNVKADCKETMPSPNLGEETDQTGMETVVDGYGVALVEQNRTMEAREEPDAGKVPSGSNRESQIGEADCTNIDYAAAIACNKTPMDCSDLTARTVAAESEKSTRDEKEEVSLPYQERIETAETRGFGPSESPNGSGNKMQTEEREGSESDAEIVRNPHGESLMDVMHHSVETATASDEKERRDELGVVSSAGVGQNEREESKECMFSLEQIGAEEGVIDMETDEVGSGAAPWEQTGENPAGVEECKGKETDIAMVDVPTKTKSCDRQKSVGPEAEVVGDMEEAHVLVACLPKKIGEEIRKDSVDTRRIQVQESRGESNDPTYSRDEIELREQEDNVLKQLEMISAIGALFFCSWTEEFCVTAL